MAGGKSKKKKWSKGKNRDQNQNKVQFEEELYTRFMAEVPKMKLITPSALVERLKVNGSLARAAIKELEAADQVKRVSYHHSQWIYTRATKVSCAMSWPHSQMRACLVSGCQSLTSCLASCLFRRSKLGRCSYPR